MYCQIFLYENNNEKLSGKLYARFGRDFFRNKNNDFREIVSELKFIKKYMFLRTGVSKPNEYGIK